MCDYSLQSVLSRPAKVGDRLTTRDFGTQTRGFSAPEDKNVAVCVLPGTELSFADWIVNELHHDGAQSQPREHQRGAEPVRQSERKRPKRRGGCRALTHR